MTNLKSARGFTLIELLVVITIIGLLASVVIGGLTVARDKANDAAIKSEVRNFTQLLNLNATEYNSYTQLQYGWDYNAVDCNNSFTGTYAVKARELCVSIVAKSGYFFTGVNTNVSGLTNDTHYSVIAWLPGARRYYCMGSSGGNSATTPNETALWVGVGCYSNP